MIISMTMPAQNMSHGEQVSDELNDQLYHQSIVYCGLVNW